MADQLQLRGGTTAQTAAFTGALREVTVDTDKDTLVVHDGALAGGYPLMRENGSNSALALGSAATPSIKFAGDTNTGIYSPGADQLALATGGALRAVIDSSGRLLVGTSSASGDQLLVVQGYTGVSAGNAEFGLRRGGNPSAANQNLGAIAFQNSSGNSGARIEAISDAGWTSGSSHPSYLAFSTTASGSASPTERMRINNIGETGLASTSTGWPLGLYQGGTAGTTNYLVTGSYGSSTPLSGGTRSFGVFTNGNVVNTNNSYGAISDVKLKENIVDAGSQWSDIKALQVRKYNFKEGQTHTQIGLVAQEVELVSPGLVTESPDRERIEVPILDANGDPVLDQDGNPQVSTEERETGTVTKSVNYSVLYMKAVKALQEAMERIEALEADVAQLKGA
jgi:hypothetical protein